MIYKDAMVLINQNSTVFNINQFAHIESGLEVTCNTHCNDLNNSPKAWDAFTF